MRMREAGVHESTIAGILRRSKQAMTQHDSVAQIVEPQAALEKIKNDRGRWNKRLVCSGENNKRGGLTRARKMSTRKGKRPDHLRDRGVLSFSC